MCEKSDLTHFHKAIDVSKGRMDNEIVLQRLDQSQLTLSQLMLRQRGKRMNEIVDREVFLLDFGRHIDACHKELAGILIHHTIVDVESLQEHHGSRLDT